MPRGHRAPRGKGVQGHAYDVEVGASQLRKGLRLSTPARLLAELAPLLRLDDLVAVGDYLIHWRLPLTTPTEIREASRAIRAGAPVLRKALDLLNERSESPQESRLRVILVLSGIARLEANYPITTSGGYRYRADLAIPGKKVIIEYQSRFHEGPSAFERDMQRKSRLEADGWYVIEANRLDLDNPADLISRITRVLASR